MKNGILRIDKGFDLLVDGVDRTSSDTKEGAYQVAQNLKKTNRNCIIEIRDRTNGNKLMMGEDGQTM